MQVEEEAEGARGGARRGAYLCAEGLQREGGVDVVVLGDEDGAHVALAP